MKMGLKQIDLFSISYQTDVRLQRGYNVYLNLLISRFN